MTSNPARRIVFAIVVSAGAIWLMSVLQSSLGIAIDVGVENPNLPAGVRVIAVTVFGAAGAVGLVIGGLPAALAAFPDAGPELWCGLAILNGLIPLCSLHLVRHIFSIGDGLLELSFRSLVVLIALQSTLSPVADQSFFYLTGLAPASIYNLLGMVVGEIIGCVLVLLVVALVWSAVRPKD